MMTHEQKMAAATDPTSGPTLLSMLADDADAGVVLAAAAHPALRSHDVAQLAERADVHVAHVLLARVSLMPVALRLLAAHPDGQVRARAAGRLRSEYPAA